MKGLSQLQLAEYCGVSSGYITEIEIGKKFPSIGVIEKISTILKIEPYLLFMGQTKTNYEKTGDEKPRLPYYVNKQLQKQLKTYIKKHVNQFTSQMLIEITDLVSKY